MTSVSCASCGEIHEGLPMAWGPLAPNAVEVIPVPERRRRVKLTTDLCVIDRRDFFVRACLDLPIVAEKERFRWLVWVKVPKPRFREIRSWWRQLRGRHFTPTRGELATALPYDASTLGLPIGLRDGGIGYRPWADVLTAEHSLGQEQRAGVTLERAYERSARALHEWTEP